MLSLLNRFILHLLPIFVLTNLAFGQVIHHTKLWTTAVFMGRLFPARSINYYLQPRLNFIDDKYKFNTALLWAGVGYSVTPRLNIWLMDGKAVIQQTGGKIVNQNTFRQQMDYQWSLDPFIGSISRLEERKRNTEPTYSVRMRQRLLARLPLIHFPGYMLVVFDELFVNLNHPKWIRSNSLFNENWAFIGIGKVLSQHVVLDIGYLNQYEWRQPSEMSNVLSLQVTVNNL